MKRTHKIVTMGLAGLAVAVGTLASPFVYSAGAMSLEEVKEPQISVKLLQQSAAAVDVDTELDCSTHTLTAKVTNKTNTAITPDVTFNEHEPNFEGGTIEPGDTANYYYSYSGNNLLMETVVNVDTYDPVTVSPMLNCMEPVSFTVTEPSSSAVVGTLRNNSTIVPQAVYTRVGNGDIRLEALQPGESRTVAMPFTGFEGQTHAFVTVATWAGYESSYSVEVGEMPRSGEE